jgi:hypothetical protein
MQSRFWPRSRYIYTFVHRHREVFYAVSIYPKSIEFLKELWEPYNTGYTTDRLIYWMDIHNSSGRRGMALPMAVHKANNPTEPILRTTNALKNNPEQYVILDANHDITHITLPRVVHVLEGKHRYLGLYLAKALCSRYVYEHDNSINEQHPFRKGLPHKRYPNLYRLSNV